MPRPRAAAGLDPATPLLLVHGPAGTGKSLFLAAWVRAHPVPGRAVLWLDAAAAPSADGLWPRVLTALAGAALLPEPDQRVRSAARGGRQAHAHVVDALRDLAGPVLLVLDGYQAVAGEQTDADLVRVLEAVPDLQVAVVTRAAPDGLRARAALRLDVDEVRPADLRLDVPETAALLDRVGVDPAAARRVRDAADGIPLAVRAVAVAAARGAVDVERAAPRELVEVAARGVVRSLGTAAVDEVYLDAARRLSVAEQLRPDLATALVGPTAPEVLARLEADGLGTWRDDPAAGTEPSFELTPVVRAALRADLDRVAPGEVDGLLREVVQWGLRVRALYPALRAAAQTRDADLMTSTVVLIWGSGQARDATETIRLLEQLPRAELARRPSLALLMALLYNARAEHRVRALEWFGLAAASTAYHLPRATPAERAVLRAGESVAMRLMGRADRARAAAVAALDGFAATPPGADAVVDGLRGLVHRQLGISVVAAGHVQEGLDAIERSLAWAEPGSLTAFHVHGLLAGLHAAQGDLVLARQHVAAAEPLEPPHRPETAYRRSTLELARIHLAVEDGDLDRAEDLLAEQADELRTNEFWPAFAEVQATVDLARGRAVAGGERLDRSMRRGRRAPASAYWRSRLLASRALLALASGQAERGLGVLGPVPSARPGARLVRARLLLSTGRADAASALLASPDLPDEGPRSRAARRLLLAVASQAEGRSAVAGTALHEAVAVADAAGCRTAGLLLSAADRAALRPVAARLADPAVDAWLADLAAVPVVVPDAVEGVGLSEREVVVLRRLADDTELAHVAEQLQVSHNTVKTQVRSVYRKLGVRSRADAVARARELGLL